MCFDTTSSNTGNRNVACVLLEQKLGKKLLHLAFRHYIMELVPACSLPRQFALTSGPDVATCKRFQINWTNIDQTRYEPEAAHEEVTSLLKDDKDSLLAFSESQLHYYQPRDDFSPGAIHHARWILKAMYSLKMWMFHGQFKRGEGTPEHVHLHCSNLCQGLVHFSKSNCIFKS